MPDNNIIEKELSMGTVQIADEVVSIIVSTAASEVEGVAKHQKDRTDTIVEFFGRKNQSKGVKVEVNGSDASAEIELIVKFGYNISEVAYEVQKRVKEALETMAGLNVISVNVNVVGIMVEKSKTENKTEK